MYEYKIKEYTPNARKNKEYWDTAIGLQDVDGLKPSQITCMNCLNSISMENSPADGQRKVN